MINACGFSPKVESEIYVHVLKELRTTVTDPTNRGKLIGLIIQLSCRIGKTTEKNPIEIAITITRLITQDK